MEVTEIVGMRKIRKVTECWEMKLLVCLFIRWNKSITRFYWKILLPCHRQVQGNKLMWVSLLCCSKLPLQLFFPKSRLADCWWQWWGEGNQGTRKSTWSLNTAFHVFQQLSKCLNSMFCSPFLWFLYPIINWFCTQKKRGVIFFHNSVFSKELFWIPIGPC